MNANAAFGPPHERHHLGGRPERGNALLPRALFLRLFGRHETETFVGARHRYLKDSGLVRCERHGKVIFYALANEIVNDVLLKGVEFLGF